MCAMSLVTWSPAIGSDAVWQIAPCTNTARSVVPAPMSTSTTPSSRSSLVSTAALDASDAEDQVVDLQAAALHALADVGRRRLRAHHQVRVHFQAHAGHADRIADAFLRIVQHVFARDRVQDLLVGGNGDGLGRFEHAVEVAVGHFAVADRHDAGRVAALHVVAGDRGVDRTDLAAGHQLGFLDRALDRLHGGFDVHDHAALEPARFVRADADHFDRIARRILADQRGHLGGADVETDDQRFVALAIHDCPCCCCGTAVGAGTGGPRQCETIGVAKVGALEHAARCCVSSCGNRRAKRPRRARASLRPTTTACAVVQAERPAAARVEFDLAHLAARSARTARAIRCRARPRRRTRVSGRRTAAGPRARRCPWPGTGGRARKAADPRPSARTAGVRPPSLPARRASACALRRVRPTAASRPRPARPARSHREEAALRVRQHASAQQLRRRRVANSPCRRAACVSGQRSAPIQPLSTATTGSTTSATARIHATMRSSAFTAAHPLAASVVSRIRQHSSSNSMPTWRAAFGTSEWLVMPGAVFTSSR